VRICKYIARRMGTVLLGYSDNDERNPVPSQPMISKLDPDTQVEKHHTSTSSAMSKWSAE
jgi:hypothetical protein